MPSPAEIPGIDPAGVGRWLSDHVDGATAPFTFERITGGRSNLTYTVVAGDGARFIMRRPPLGNVLATAHDMAREHRIISAVHPTGVPVPEPLGLCCDESVTGAPFYVMSYVEGTVLDGPDKVASMSHEQRRRSAEHLVDVLVDLHAVDVDECGLGDLARREGYVQRQLRRWSAQWESSKTREVPAVDAVAAALSADVPEQQAVAIAHGDYRFGNCIVDTAKASVEAVLDWELCTLGDPLADVGYLGVYWGGDDGAGPGHPNDPTHEPGFPPYCEVLARYAERSGLDVDGIGYYIAFSAWRLAVISEGVYARYRAGVMGDADPAVVAMFETSTVTLADRALAALSA